MSERDKLLITIVIMVLIGVVYCLYLMPPLLDKVKSLRNQEITLVNEITEAENVIGQSKTIMEQYKFLNARILAFSENFFQKLEQERIILILDDILTESGLQARSISFKDTQNAALIDFTPDKIDAMKSRSDLPCMEISLAYNGSFHQLLSFLGKINDHHKKIIVKDINLVNASQDSNTSNLAGNIALEFYAIPSLVPDTNGVLVWSDEGEGGINDPFTGGSLVGVFTDLAADSIDDLCDLVLTVKPITADLPTVVCGIDADVSADSFVFADNPGIEEVEVRLFVQDGEYLCSYKTSQESYPHGRVGIPIPFVNNDEKVVMKVFSNPRTGPEDQSGVNVRLFNETDKPFYVYLINEDLYRPRVNFVEISNNVLIQ